MKQYKTPSSCCVNKVMRESASFKSVAHSFSRGFSKGVMGGHSEPLKLLPNKLVPIKTAKQNII